MAKILVIDDSEVMRDLLRDFLTDLGHEVDVSEDGRDGIELVERETYEVCICDMHMPGLNGLEVYRELSGSRPNLRLIFTDSLPDHLSEQVRSAGDVQWLRKPFELEQLRKVLEFVLKTDQVR